MASIPLMERFRPKTLDDVIGQDVNVQRIKAHIKDGIESFPHLLFYGPPGTGKTSCAYALAHDLNCEIIELNASTDRGIDVVRDKVEELAKTMSIKGGRKIIFLDEADELTDSAQTALRRIIELNYDTTIFIFSCNAHHKMIPAIINRCTDLYFGPLSADALKVMASKITAQLNATITETDLDIIVERAKGSGRQLMSVISEYLVGGVVPDGSLSLETYISAIKKMDYSGALSSIYNVGYEDVVLGLIDYLAGMAVTKPDIYAIITKIGDWIILNPSPNEVILKKTLTSYLIHYREWLS